MSLKNNNNNIKINTCPCHSGNSFSDCCEPYLTDNQHAETPKKLMRSRYSAYTMADIDYIQKTMCKKAAENYDPISSKNWASSVTWLGLTVIEAPTPTRQFGTVTFFARFLENSNKKHIYEKSHFEKINGQWFYVDGVMLKANRNDNCPCGSQKKFKRCCA